MRARSREQGREENGRKRKKREIIEIKKDWQRKRESAVKEGVKRAVRHSVSQAGTEKNAGALGSHAGA